MIERMKAVYVVTSEDKKEELLAKLRDLSILHIAQRSSADSASADRFTQLSKTSNDLKEYAQKKQPQQALLSDAEFEGFHKKVMATLAQRSEAAAKRTADLIETDKISKWGDFDPKDFDYIKEELGITFRFFLLGKKEYAELCSNEDIQFIHLKSIDKMEVVAVLGDKKPDSGLEFMVPQKGLSQLAAEIKECEGIMASCDEELKKDSRYLNSYQDQLVKAQNVIEYSSVSRTTESDGGLIWLSGYIPVSDTEKFVAAAKENNWAWCMEDVVEDDGEVPTKVQYSKISKLMKPVFGILGTIPGYNEYDISFWFLCFFSLFFAMIIGDAAYGCIILIGTIALTVKTKSVSDATILLFVLSISTIIWGAVTGTWFGLESAMKVPFLKSLVIPAIANYPEYFGVTTTAAQNNVMKFCFTIGVIHLALACIMNIRTKIKKKDLSWLADLGWLAAICALYILVLYLVVGQAANIPMVFAVVIFGFILVVLFGGMSPDKTFAQGLKAGLADSFTTFLNTISAFGNVMSYIRLFAVGMAGLAISQSFNGMASGFSGPLVIIGAFIMVFGHVLNIIMCFLSVAVHGIRLNLLEFSGQLGMEWSGTEYDPFRILDKVRK